MERYKLRQEYFGGLLYDTQTKKIMYIDEVVYQILSGVDKKIIINESKKTDNALTEMEYTEIIKTLHKFEIIDNYRKIGKYTSEDYLSGPTRVFYDISYKCNYSCKHCFTDSGENYKKRQELSLEKKLSILDQMSELGIFRISIAGGEPLICKDFFDFITYSKKIGIDVSFSTNASALNIENIKKLNNLELKTITISVDAGTKNTFNYVRFPGTLKKLEEKLNLLKNNYNGNVAFKTTLMKVNINELEEIIKLGIKHMVRSIKFNAMRIDGRAVDNTSLHLSQKEYIDSIERLVELKKKYSSKINLKLPLNIIDKTDYNYIKTLGFGCFAGKESVCIDPYGNVKPCSHFPDEFIIGNITKNDLSRLWYNSKILSQFRNLEGNKECLLCQNYSHCRAGCRYRAFLNGNINEVDPFCYMYKNNPKVNTYAN